MSKLITNPGLACRKAADRALRDAGNYQHRWCNLPDCSTRLATQKADVPRGFARSLSNWLRTQGFEVRLQTDDDMRTVQEVARHHRPRPLSNLGYTSGWLPNGAPCPPFTVTVNKNASAAVKLAVLCHEAGHAILGHTPTDMWDAISGAKAQDDPEQEIACQVGASILMDLASVKLDCVPDYIAHCPEGITPSSVQNGILVAETILPVVEQSLN